MTEDQHAIQTNATGSFGIGYWYFDEHGRFYVGLDDCEGNEDFLNGAQTFLGQFNSAGCDPTGITDAEIGVVAWYMSAYEATVTGQSFNTILRTARAVWADLVPHALINPWWETQGVAPSPRRTLSHGDYLRLLGLFALANDHYLALSQIERSAKALLGLPEDDDHVGDAVWNNDGAAVLLRRLDITPEVV